VAQTVTIPVEPSPNLLSNSNVFAVRIKFSTPIRLHDTSSFKTALKNPKTTTTKWFNKLDDQVQKQFCKQNADPAQHHANEPLSASSTLRPQVV